MSFFDYAARTNSAEARSALQEEIEYAQSLNGHVRQHDWWAISDRAVADQYAVVHDEDTVQYLIDASIDTRHVAIFHSPLSHLDPYELKRILKAAPVDGSTILAAYLIAFANVLEGHYSKACKLVNYHPFIQDGQVRFSDFDCGDEEFMNLLASLWEKSKREIAFDAGRKQILYKALEDDLTANDLKPGWFIPSDAFLPFGGRQAQTDEIVYDLQVYRIPSNALKTSVGLGAKIANLFKATKS
ncbi:hypothetical protein [uncultured Roseovarius sp.]|uniref:hypothetical protein n=1 Tax=uncultured Roseovarius sp. TaxID=293344 RepID=UPI00260F1A7D|nr:hypothetical protein [uncultured Roseovarius sp.]